MASSKLQRSNHISIHLNTIQTKTNTITEPEHSDASEFVKDSTPSNGIVFDGLYDKETVNGNSSASEEDFVEKKTKVPVIICVVCAIICVIATALVLFVVPSKYNLLN